MESDIKAITDHMTLNQVLKALGFKTRAAGNHLVQYQKDVLDNDGQVLFTGAVAEVWLWVRSLHLEQREIDALKEAGEE